MAGLLRFLFLVYGCLVILQGFAEIIKSLTNKILSLFNIKKSVSLRIFQILGIISCIFYFHLFFTTIYHHGLSFFNELLYEQQFFLQFTILPIVTSVFLTIGEDNLEHDFMEYKGSLPGAGLFLAGCSPFISLLITIVTKNKLSDMSLFLNSLGYFKFFLIILLVILVLIFLIFFIICAFALLLSFIFAIWGIINMIRGLRKPSEVLYA